MVSHSIVLHHFVHDDLLPGGFLEGSHAEGVQEKEDALLPHPRWPAQQNIQPEPEHGLTSDPTRSTCTLQLGLGRNLIK